KPETLSYPVMAVKSVAVLRSVVASEAGVSEGFACLSSAATAATCGAAAEVPRKLGRMSLSYGGPESIYVPIVWLSSTPKEEVLTLSGPITSGFCRGVVQLTD